jgi:hypothetical protein
MNMQDTRDTVLIVEDSTTFSTLLKRRISQTLGLPTLVAQKFRLEAAPASA